jgi:putative hydrolase of the HAD superfamily
MNHIQAILFDVGGTLLEGEMPWFDLYQRALSLAARPMALREMVAGYESAIRNMVAAKQTAESASAGAARRLTHCLAEAFGLSEGRLRAAVDEVIFDHPEALHLTCVAGAGDVLAELRSRGYRLAVVSNWSADLPLVLSRAELKEHFEAVFASEALGYAKPHSAAFLIPLDRLGLTPGQAAYVGDLYDVDVVGAREVGLTPVLFDQLALGLHPDVLTVTRMIELLDIFTGR